MTIFTMTRARALLGMGKRDFSKALGISDNHRRALENMPGPALPRTTALAIAAQLLHRAAAVRAEAEGAAGEMEREARALLMAHGAGAGDGDPEPGSERP